MTDQAILDWLLTGDVALQYLTCRELLGDERSDLRARIEHEGWGAQVLAARNPDGSWGRGFYQPQWTCSHYTLLDLKTLGLPQDNRLARASVHDIATAHRGADGGINPPVSGATNRADVCINGMFLNYASYFGQDQQLLCSVVDFLLGQQMPDGGFNCRKNRSGARHSSLHSTISVLEGITEYVLQGYGYRTDELGRVAAGAREFILQHRLYKSDRTGAVIHPELLKLSVPPRWKYNILRALDHFRTAGVAWDERMRDAIDALLAKRRPDGRWTAQSAPPGQTHVVMEPARAPSRWNTLRAVCVLRTYNDSLTAAVS